MTDPTGTESPAPRSTRANATAMRSGLRSVTSVTPEASATSGTARHRRADELRDAVGADPFLIFAVLQDRPERHVDRAFVEPGPAERGEGLRPVDRLRDSRRFVELEPAERL